MRVYNHLKTERCFPLCVHNLDQGKESVGDYIISLETLDKLVEMFEPERMNFFEFSQYMSLAWLALRMKTT